MKRKLLGNSQLQFYHHLPQEVVVDVFRKKSSRDRVLPPEVIIDAPRIKGDIAVYSDDEQVDELPFRTKEGIIGYGGESSVHNHQSMDKWKVPTSKVKLLPATPFGLVKRFRKIFTRNTHQFKEMSLSRF